MALKPTTTAEPDPVTNRELVVALAKANGHPDPEGYADLVLSYLAGGGPEPEAPPTEA
jgi:hypothetical protein